MKIIDIMGVHVHKDHIAVAGGQITGSRKQQEDCFSIREFTADDGSKGLLLVLCDGMGGSDGGEIASRLVCDTFSEIIHGEGIGTPWRLANAMEVANRNLAERIKEDHQLVGMGTTLTAAVIRDEQLYWLSVGDSPLWLYRNGGLQRLNDDHSMKAILKRQVEAGEISAEAAARDVTRHSLLSALCGTPPPMIDLPQEPFRLLAGDLLLLASDGLEVLSVGQISQILGSVPDDKPDAVLALLLEKLEDEKHPQQDNATAILVKWEGGAGGTQVAQKSSEADEESVTAPERIDLRLLAAAALIALTIGAWVYFM